jgi:hypothetical protein
MASHAARLAEKSAASTSGGGADLPPRPAEPPALPPKPQTPYFTKPSECDLCGKIRYPISDDELLVSATMPMSYRCFNCGLMSKRFEAIELHRKQTDHVKIGMAHSDLGEVRCGYCKSILEKDAHSHNQ